MRDDLKLEALPRYAAPFALKQRVQALAAQQKTARGRRFAVAAIVIALLVAGVLWRSFARDESRGAVMAAAAVSAHLRLLNGDEPLQVAASDMHQVKPWFSGRIDFAPAVRFRGDEEFILQGGAITAFAGRPAAAYVFKRRLHTLSLLVFPATAVDWPSRFSVVAGPVVARVEQRLGFNVALWREGDLGYALSSDINVEELEQLAARIAAP